MGIFTLSLALCEIDGGVVVHHKVFRSLVEFEHTVKDKTYLHKSQSIQCDHAVRLTPSCTIVWILDDINFSDRKLEKIDGHKCKDDVESSG